jgi:hypothetical protein
MEIDGISPVLNLDVIDAAEKIVRMGVYPVRRARRIDIGPATGNQDLRVTDAQEGKRGIHGRIDARHQAAKFFLRLCACAAGTSPGLNLILKRFRKAQLVAVGVEQMKVSLAPFGLNMTCSCLSGDPVAEIT